MCSIFRGRPAAAAADGVPTDQVIPLHFFDDSLIFRSIIVYMLIVVNDVLDPEKLRGSLERLIQRHGWQKLGGRLRKTKHGNLEYHVPARFSQDDRPATGFQHIQYDTILAGDHPSGCRIPKPSTRPAIVGDPDQLKDLISPAGSPSTLDDYLKPDRPTLGLAVTSFKDKTLIVLHWPHLALDCMGMKALVAGWSLVLQGREDEIATPVGFDLDPLAELGKHATEPHKLADRRVSKLGLASYVLRNAYGLAIQAKEIRMVCIPAAFWQTLHATALEYLKSETESEGPRFLSENDVLTAWWIRMTVAHLGLGPDTTVVAQTGMSARKALEDDDTLPAGHPYLSNAFGFFNVILTAKDILDKPLGWLAMRVRGAISEQSTRGQLEAYMALQRANYNLPVFFGHSNMHQVSFSNWQKAGLFSADFSAAAVPDKLSRVSYVQQNQVPFAFPEGFIMSGKDGEGNWWLSGYRKKGYWDMLEAELALAKA